ncbi:hypothetical protein BDZ94DRAFT_1245556 [Collybia nuda]|uniref:Uncharacterized protein n=1 Tax=Collybia nuda TaxID=64659 RepID=A0A9P6CNQ8_9AGAR|nr:hypothetical protein BDZ94DRAFT_1245556 [Collybia nuda]
MSTASANPSELLTASLAALSKSAYQAFAEIENKARSEVARATVDACEARAERDKLKNTLHEFQLEGHSWKQEIHNCKAALKQAEITIAHQTETITQLRREANQWKDQSRNWQEHFLRVEQERCALSTRIDELVAEQLQWNRTGAHIPFTPQHQFSNIMNSASSSTTTKRASTSSLNPSLAYKSARPASPPEPDSPSASMSISSHKPLRSAKKAKRSKNNMEDRPVCDLPTSIKVPKTQSLSSDASAQLQQGPHQTLIRRVHAVVHVKREDSDYESVETESKEENTSGGSKTKSRVSQRRKRKVAIFDNDDYGSGEGNQSDHFDGEDEEDEEDNEDDELMMGAEENHHELYGTQRIKVLPKNNHSRKDPPSPTKKRKLAVINAREKPSVRKN